jgi:predicted DNA-binding WGR domain protein
VSATKKQKMKLIEQSKLFFKEANSDKVYEIDLCEVGNDLYVVNFRFGKRGANLKDGTKTPSPIGRIKAKAVFTALETEKRKKGYQTETEMFQELPDISTTAPNTVEGTLLQRLQNAVDSTKDKEVNTFKTKWKTSRVAWKVGVLRFKEAVPFLMKLIEKGDAMQRYSILWALVRCGDERAMPTFKAYFNNDSYAEHVCKIAKEGILGLRNVEKTENKELQKGVQNQLFESLPPIIQQLVKNESSNGLEKEIDLRVAEKQKDFQFLETLYLLAHVYPFLSKVILNVLAKLPLRPPFFKYIRSIYKLAEVRDDARLLGMLAYRFEKSGSMYKSVSVSEDMKEDSWWYKRRTRKYFAEMNEQIADITKEVKKKDSKIGFSQQTKEHFQHRDLTRLKEYGVQTLENETQNHNYVKLATAILLGYQQVDYQAAYSQLIGSNWNRETSKYTQHFAFYPECSSSMLLNLILNGHNEEMELVKNKWQNKEKITLESQTWTVDTPQAKKQGSATERVRNFSLLTKNEQKEEQKLENRNEFFPQKWDALPQAYIQLLVEGQLGIIHEFAYKNLKVHEKYEELISKFDIKLLKKLLSSNFVIPSFFGVQICKEKLNQSFDKELTLILLNSQIEEGRNLAKEIIQKNSFAFTQDVDFNLFVSQLIFNHHSDIRSWANQFLQTLNLSEEKWQIIVAKSISEMLVVQNLDKSYSEQVRNHILKDAQTILKTNAKSVLEKLSWTIVLELLENEMLQNQVFASDILLLKSKLIKATDIPFSILNGFFESKSEEIRANGMEIFAAYPENALLEAHELLGNMLISPYQNLRNSARQIVIKLVANSFEISKQTKYFSESIVTKLILALRKKDPEETKREEAEKQIRQEANKSVNQSDNQSNNAGIHSLPNDIQLSVHKEIADLLITFFDAYLSKITLKTTLNLLHGNYREGQFVGFYILKNHIITNTSDKEKEISIRQLIALAAHELLEIRNWTLEYYQDNIPRIRYERDEALRILDTKWDDVRQKAMQFFRENFTENDWDVDSLVSIADSVRPDVEAFGKELITKFFEEKDGEKYLTMLSQHPSNSMQLFATNYLERFATGNLPRLKEMEFYFRCVLMQVNKGRIAKDRVLEFLEKEALSSKETAFWVVPLFNDLVATSAVQDKERFIQILQKLKTKYDNLKVALVFE